MSTSHSGCCNCYCCLCCCITRILDAVDGDFGVRSASTNLDSAHSRPATREADPTAGWRRCFRAGRLSSERLSIDDSLHLLHDDDVAVGGFGGPIERANLGLLRLYLATREAVPMHSQKSFAVGLLSWGQLLIVDSGCEIPFDAGDADVGVAGRDGADIGDTERVAADLSLLVYGDIDVVGSCRHHCP